MKPKHKRLTFVVIAVGLLGAAVALVLVAFEENIVYFFSPTEVLERKPPREQRVRMGGLVEEGSVERPGGAQVTFRVTDLANTVPVVYVGLLPDLFREGQGVIVEGYVENGVLRAQEVLAKHDENYMPPEVAEALKKSGQWRDPRQGMGDSQ
jgi:cytochrome c-type biogenesis protein CcmE